MLVRLVQIWTPIDFMYILPLLVARHCPKLSSYAMLNKTNEPNLRKKQKRSFGPNFDPNLDPSIFCVGFTTTPS